MNLALLCDHHCPSVASYGLCALVKTRPLAGLWATPSATPHPPSAKAAQGHSRNTWRTLSAALLKPDLPVGLLETEPMACHETIELMTALSALSNDRPDKRFHIRPSGRTGGRCGFNPRLIALREVRCGTLDVRDSESSLHVKQAYVDRCQPPGRDAGGGRSCRP